jgi:hypothetical protein
MFKYNSEFSVLGSNDGLIRGRRVAEADSEVQDMGGVEIKSATAILLFAL